MSPAPGGSFGNTSASLRDALYAGQLHVTQNEGCEKAEVISVFPVAGVDAYFFPYSEASGPGGSGSGVDSCQGRAFTWMA